MLYMLGRTLKGSREESERGGDIVGRGSWSLVDCAAIGVEDLPKKIISGSCLIGSNDLGHNDGDDSIAQSGAAGVVVGNANFPGGRIERAAQIVAIGISAGEGSGGGGGEELGRKGDGDGGVGSDGGGSGDDCEVDGVVLAVDGEGV